MKRNHEKSSGNVFADLGFPNSEQAFCDETENLKTPRLIPAIHCPV